MSKIFRLHKQNIPNEWIELNQSNILSSIELPQISERYCEETKIWRYLDFSKFVSLLHFSNLFFTRLDKFYDQYEGDFIGGDLQNIYSSYDKRNILSNEVKQKLKCISKMGSFANCWHINEFENYGMWKSYLKSEEGVAIQTDIRSLKLSLKENNQHSFIIDKVAYIDYSAEKSAKEIYKRYSSKGERITIIPAFFKNKFYEFENELRVVVYYELVLPDVSELSMGRLLEMESSAKEFIQATVNLDILIQNVYVHPDAPSWFRNLVNAVMDEYKIKKQVLTSQLKKN